MLNGGVFVFMFESLKCVLLVQHTVFEPRTKESMTERGRTFPFGASRETPHNILGERLPLLCLFSGGGQHKKVFRPDQTRGSGWNQVDGRKS